MKFRLFFSSVFVFSSAFAVDWQKVDELDGKSFYVDVANIEKQDKFVYYSELIDFKESIYGALSRISTFKANCATMERANISITSYTGQMGKYIVINEAKNDGTRFIEDSQSSTLRFACAQTM
jgi:hypothetical protein